MDKRNGRKLDKKRKKRQETDSESRRIEELLSGSVPIGKKLTMGEQMDYLVQENENLRILARKLYRDNIELKKYHKGKSKLGIAFIVAGLVMALIFFWGEFQNYKTAREIKKLQEQKQEAMLSSDDIDLTDILPEYRKMYKTNSDLVGWLVIEGTDINYPVVQSKVYQEYYLDHDFDGEDNEAGAIFADARNDVMTPDDNVILYGHNMKNGSMFGTLQYYLKESYYKEHRVISFDTLYERYTYEIVFVGLSKVTDEKDDSFKYYDFLNAESKKSFKDYIYNIKKLQAYDTNVDIKYGDKLITLSTCNSVEQDGRLFVIAKRKGKKG